MSPWALGLPLMAPRVAAGQMTGGRMARRVKRLVAGPVLQAAALAPVGGWPALQQRQSRLVLVLVLARKMAVAVAVAVAVMP